MYLNTVYLKYKNITPTVSYDKLHGNYTYIDFYFLQRYIPG
jgi:hypothetical protein